MMGKRLSNKIAVGSIGSAGEPFFDQHNRRVKGFCTSVVYDNPGVPEDYMKRAVDLMYRTGAKRATVRFVMKNRDNAREFGLVTPVYTPSGDVAAYGIESRVPLAGEWGGFWVEYHAQNAPEMIETEEKQAEEDRLLEMARAGKPVSRDRDGYEIVTGINGDSDIGQLFDLYREVYDDYTFPITPENVESLALNPKSIVATARTGGRIVSAAVAEVIEIQMDRGLLRMSEISDEATHPDYRRNGLNQSCVSSLTEELLSTYGHDIHLIYAEDRAVSLGVNRQSANLGWKYAGRLNRHCIISGEGIIDIDGPYEDLNVWYYPLGGKGDVS